MNAFSAPPWLSQSNLEALYRVNERCLELMSDLASERTALPANFGIVRPLRRHFAVLTPEIRRRAAAHPFLLLDVQFGDLAWWHRLRDRPQSEARAGGAPMRPRVIALAREALTLAWRIAQSGPEATAVLLGAAQGVDAVLTGFSVADIGRLAHRHAEHLAPRWGERPIVWQELLLSAKSGDRRALLEMRLHGLQLLGGDAMRAAERRRV